MEPTAKHQHQPAGANAPARQRLFPHQALRQGVIANTDAIRFMMAMPPERSRTHRHPDSPYLADTPSPQHLKTATHNHSKGRSSKDSLPACSNRKEPQCTHYPTTP